MATALAGAAALPTSAKPDAGPSSMVAAKGADFVVPLARFDLGKLDHDGVAFGPDADGDGLQDFVITTRWDVDRFASLTVVSSKTGKPCYCRRDYVGLLPSQRTFPTPLAWDAGGDGAHDILLGIPERSQVALLSGKDGRLLRSFPGKTAGFGTAVSIGPDFDGDGKSDIAVGSPGARLVQLLSGDSGKEIDSWAGPTFKGFGRTVVLRTLQGHGPMLAIASYSSDYLFDPKGDKKPLFVFEGLDSPEFPSPLSFARDVDGDGFRDFVATSWGGTSGPSGAFSIHARKFLGFYHAIPFVDLDGNQKTEWVYPVDRGIGPLMFGTDDGAPAKDNYRALKAVSPVPPYLTDEFKQDLWDVDESGRYLLTWSDGNLTLYAVGARVPNSSAETPLVPIAPVECPLLFGPESSFPPEAEAALLPTLSRLAENLEKWGRTSAAAALPTSDKRAKAKLIAERAAAGQVLAKIADPEAGLWFWENTGVVAIPSVRFPPSRKQRSDIYSTIATAARGAASYLREALRRPDFAQTITRSPLVIADILRSLDARDEKKRIDRTILRALPMQAKVRLAASPDSDDEPWSVEIYLTVRGKRLYVAHVIYQDGSA